MAAPKRTLVTELGLFDCQRKDAAGTSWTEAKKAALSPTMFKKVLTSQISALAQSRQSTEAGKALQTEDVSV